MISIVLRCGLMKLRRLVKTLFVYEEPKQDNELELLEGEDENFSEEFYEKPPEDLQVGLKGKIDRLLKRVKKDEIQQSPSGSGRLDKDLQNNLERLKHEFNLPTNHDIVVREISVLRKKKAFIMYLEGMVDENTIDNYILRQLIDPAEKKLRESTDLVDYIINNVLAANQCVVKQSYLEVIERILNGHTALFIDGYGESIIIDTVGYEKRSVSTPQTEIVVQGPQEGFVEDMRTNVTLVRRILRNSNLFTEIVKISPNNNMNCAILYIKNIANRQIVEELKRRISGLEIDFISDGAIVELLEDHPNALFPQILSTEGPDRVSALLSDGRVAIIFDGTPMANIVPMTFFHFFHTAEDFSLRWQYGTFLRIVRLLATLSAIFLPGYPRKFCNGSSFNLCPADRRFRCGKFSRAISTRR